MSGQTYSESVVKVSGMRNYTGASTLNPDGGTSVHLADANEFIENYNNNKISEVVLVLDYGKVVIRMSQSK